MVLFYAVVTCAQVRTLCLHCATGEAGTPPLPAVRSQSSLYPRHAAFERWGLWGRVDDDSWRCEKCSGRPLRMATKVGKAPGGNVTFFGYGFLVVPARRWWKFLQKKNAERRIGKNKLLVGSCFNHRLDWNEYGNHGCWMAFPLLGDGFCTSWDCKARCSYGQIVAPVQQRLLFAMPNKSRNLQRIPFRSLGMKVWKNWCNLLLASFRPQLPQVNVHNEPA